MEGQTDGEVKRGLLEVVMGDARAGHPTMALLATRWAGLGPETSRALRQAQPGLTSRKLHLPSPAPEFLLPARRTWLQAPARCHRFDGGLARDFPNRQSSHGSRSCCQLARRLGGCRAALAGGKRRRLVGRDMRGALASKAPS